MFALKSFCFYLFLIFVAVPQVVSSAQMNKTSSDGKIFITGDHNEVVVSTARETKIALDEIKKKLQSLSEKDEKFSEEILSLDKIRRKMGAMNETIKIWSKKVESLDENIERKLDLVNKSNAALSVQVQAMSQTFIQTTLERQGKLDAMNQTIEALSKTIESLDESIERKLDLVNKSNAALIQAMSKRLTTLERQVQADYALLFPRKGTTDYVITRGMPSLTAVTVCFWMKTADTGNDGTPLSYAVSGSTNELLVYDYRHFYLYVGSSHSGQTSVSANDGKWHHICATWKNTAGSWNLFKDGKVAASGKGLKTGHVIRGGGVLVLGQEQDAVGGTFDANQCFIGEMTGVNIWDRVITNKEIMHMSQSCLTGVGNVFQWRDFKGHVKGSVKIIHPSC